MGLHAAWLLVLVVGYKLCKCSASTVYPISFIMSDGLFFLTFYILKQLKKSGLEFVD